MDKVLPSLKIGTRGSKLALWQAGWVKTAIKANHPGLSIEIVTIKTKGDKVLDVPLARIGGKGLFVKEIEESLLKGQIDLAVHSMKDMPVEIPKGLSIGAIPERETPNDVLISREKIPFSKLRSGARIGTSSLRRTVQLRHAKPDVAISPLRGNLDTRIQKLQTENIDAIVLAAAGVKRMNLENSITELLDEEIMLPAVGQGALCIEIRENDPEVTSVVAGLDHPQTRTAVLGERAFLRRLEGSCQVPIAAHGKIRDDRFVLCGLVASLDGTKVIKDSLSGPEAHSETIGLQLADRLLSQGGREILDQIRFEAKKTDER